MKYIFIVNPKSGKNELKEELLSQLNKLKDNIDYEIYVTKKEKDATDFVNQYCNTHKEDVVFCACGGDGTLNEVVNGAIGHNNAIVTCFPCGSGNDFVKVYGSKDLFLNLKNLINGEETKIDVMKVNDMYAINVTNFGFEAKVCDIANKVRRKKIIGGKNSYTTGIIVSIFKGRKNKCKIEVDGDLVITKDILLATLANGKYVGGAYQCAPRSNNEDGLLEVCIVKPISLFRFISLIKPYKEGRHLDIEKLKRFIIYKQAKEIKIEADEGFKICLDGEIYTGTSFNIINIKQALRFIKPKTNHTI